ncbi:Uma2 family endonuclease [Armatimonas sp.]|uniref:Uma2 family endonuclease n=1 Tax=Armatimonas sp. TaxID=1872638 RepID=UPI00374D655D
MSGRVQSKEKELAPPIFLFGEYELRLPLGFDPTNREQFFRVCQANQPLGLERTPEGRLSVTMPTGGRTGNRNSELNYQLMAWNRQRRSGYVFDSNTGFELPNGAMRAPDVAWVSKPRLDAISEVEREKFLPLAPEFVIELRSDSDRLPPLKTKMQEYLTAGVSLALLLDPSSNKVYIYRPGAAMVELDNPTTLDCSPELPGFLLELEPIFNPQI